MKNRGFIKYIVVLVVLVVIGISGYLAVTKVYTLDTLKITGNEIYADAQISDIILDDEHAWSTLYVYFKYRYKKDLAIPFVDTMELTMVDPHTIAVRVYEKGVLGFVYIESVGQNAYFDKDGIVAEISPDTIEEVPRVDGLSVGKVVLYEKLDIEDASSLSDLLLLTGLLEKYDIKAEVVRFAGSEMSVMVGDISAQLGTSESLTEKIMRLEQILKNPALEGKKGTLHLENWSAKTSDIVFEPEKN